MAYVEVPNEFPKEGKVSVDTLNELLICDSENGKLYWKHRPRHYFPTEGAYRTQNTLRAGKEAFTSSDANG